jgi:hypothetical protein
MSRRLPDSELWRISYGFVLFALLGVAVYFDLHRWLGRLIVAPMFH